MRPWGVSATVAGPRTGWMVPAAESTRWDLRSDWPHPSFGGRFLPTQREVSAAGFNAQWTVSALATNAPRDVLEGGQLCQPGVDGNMEWAAYPAAAPAAAERAIAPWRDEAIAHFRKVSEESFIALPSGRTKVSWDFSDPEHLVLVVRVACPSVERHPVEQAVFRDTYDVVTASGVRPRLSPVASMRPVPMSTTEGSSAGKVPPRPANASWAAGRLPRKASNGVGR